MTELDTGARAEVLTAFRSRAGWHRGSDVDRLSEQEARVLSDRLLGRLVAMKRSVDAKRAAVGSALTEAIRGLLVEGCTSASICRDRLLAVARKHLDKAKLTSLREAIDRGFQPVGSER